MQQSVTLSVCEAELYAATECAQDMMFMYRVLLSIGLKVKLPMKIGMDNQGAIALINNWSSGGRTRHIDTKLYFLRELKAEEPSLILPEYVHTDSNESDIFTKASENPVFLRHLPKFVGEDDEYLKDEEGSTVEKVIEEKESHDKE